MTAKSVIEEIQDFFGRVSDAARMTRKWFVETDEVGRMIAITLIVLTMIVTLSCLTSCGNQVGGGGTQYVTNTMSNNQSQTTGAGGAGTSAYEITITAVGQDSTTTVDSAGMPSYAATYTVYFTDTVAMNTPSVVGYSLIVDGSVVTTGIKAMSGYGSVGWRPASSGSHLLAIWDSTGRKSQPWEVVAP